MENFLPFKSTLGTSVFSSTNVAVISTSKLGISKEQLPSAAAAPGIAPGPAWPAPEAAVQVTVVFGSRYLLTLIELTL
jgi:hypothetical protein